MPDAAVRTRRPEFVCFSHLRWDFVYQRPQHLLSRACRRYRVTFVEEPVFEADISPRLDVSERAGGIVVAVPFLPSGIGDDEAADQIERLIRPCIGGPAPAQRVLWYYTPMAMAFSHQLAASVVVYDNMDDLSAFLGAPPRLLALEDELLARADLVFTGGVSLYRAKRHRHPNIHAFPSSIDVEHFVMARQGVSEDPHDQAGIPHPRIGFFGVIDERMDVRLVRKIAERRPDLQLVMLGPVVKIDPAILPRLPNVHWLGFKSYLDLPQYLAGWDAGFMPFALNESTRFISPTKTLEFLAAGLPLVSTAITDVVSPYGEAGLVQIGHDADDFVARLDEALAQPRQPWLAKVDRQLASTSWDSTWNSMYRLIEAAAATSSVPRVPQGRPAPAPSISGPVNV